MSHSLSSSLSPHRSARSDSLEDSWDGALKGAHATFEGLKRQKSTSKRVFCFFLLFFFFFFCSNSQPTEAKGVIIIQEINNNNNKNSSRCLLRPLRLRGLNEHKHKQRRTHLWLSGKEKAKMRSTFFLFLFLHDSDLNLFIYLFIYYYYRCSFLSHVIFELCSDSGDSHRLRELSISNDGNNVPKSPEKKPPIIIPSDISHLRSEIVNISVSVGGELSGKFRQEMQQVRIASKIVPPPSIATTAPSPGKGARPSQV